MGLGFTGSLYFSASWYAHIFGVLAMALTHAAASVCGGPVVIRMYRKRKAAREMFDALEKKAPSPGKSDKQKAPQQSQAAAAAVPEIWTPVSTVDSFLNTSQTAGKCNSVDRPRI